MKNRKKAVICVALIAMFAASFFAGSHIKEREQMENRAERCHTLLTFALDKAENQDLSDQNVMEVLISNIYAAREFCDDPYLAEQLDDLWNDLIFERASGDSDLLVSQLRGVLETLRLNG